MASVVADRGFATGKAPTGPSLALFVVAALVSSAILLWAVRDPLFAAAFLGGTIATGGILVLLAGTGARTELISADEEPEALDPNLLRVVLDGAGGSAALAITSASDLELLAANETFSRWFGAPASIGELAEGVHDPARLHNAAALARAEGGEVLPPMVLAGAPMRVEVRVAGAAAGHLVWRFERSENSDLAAEAKRIVTGRAGRRMGEAGIMAVIADPGGTIIAANQVFAVRATGETDEDVTGAQLVRYLSASSSGQFHFTSEGRGATPLRILRVPVEEGEEGLALFLMLDELGFSGASGEEGVHILLEHIPLGLALADMDGRFTFLNRAFRKAAGLGPQEGVAWPGDLVVEEDKSAVSDFVHRYARGRGAAGDLAVRLRSNPEEPVALTVAGARGLGNAAVLLSLKDNSEEARLKREIAQATKMQAVGQLAGGVAHDFNNILTAILGTCDLMLMRHLPGDPDYDDIQQIRSNSNRAANLTRQLLAFSRQQTLRPQVLQLPDAVSEVSHLLHRLLGETVKLQVKHGRNLGAIRADPGQLEQVIVNLAVNARDAMQSKGEGVGTLSIETFAVSADDVRRMGTDILPIGDYTALRVTDTGTGIPPHLISKIFEPFFTTKEVGKGTGLGLSTVYGIVKQSGGFIFADSQIGEGTSFTIYLPVHHAAGSEEAPKPKLAKETQPGDWWGSGTILLVEDEAVVRAVAERALTRHGYTVLSAESGEEALEILRREDKVDLMVSDVVMPTMDGPTTVRHARETHPDLPILFISGYAEEQLRKSIDIDNVAFLPKPFSVQQLAETVRDTLRAK